ncbi:Glycosyl transferase group 1 [uncultured Paludibacter sp.]|uniref:Glycosyl transferase group 1 n=1 Tax=uncultured Paludibacter sp. TaxID=497635 RepID=A0A653A5Y9_9BACT|nr:Glycosyl transferase group 1 [uncultured Paludibacter sp.]
MNVLFISAWYPHRYDSMAGLFVQKHAEAVSLYADVKVLYVHADDKIKKNEITVNQHNNIQEYRVYYPFSEKTFLAKIKKTINYFWAYQKGLKAIKKTGWKIEIIHLHTIIISGLIAYFYKLFHNIPYVITEHWSRYLTTNNTFSNKFDKFITKIITKNASAIMPVSNILKNGMIENGLKNDNYLVINNVVDDFFYQDKLSTQKQKKRILHISCFDEAAKNVNGMLCSIKNLSTLRNDFELVIIGTGKDYVQTRSYCETLKIPKDTVLFLGEKTPKEVAEWFRKSDVFVLFSNYETAGVVIAESLVSGVPVISTKVGIAPEVINEINGKLIEIGDEKALTQTLNKVLNNLPNYNNKEIQNNSKDLFSYKNVGKKIVKVYENCLKI